MRAGHRGDARDSNVVEDYSLSRKCSQFEQLQRMRVRQAKKNRSWDRFS
jgi:hypothetical protein